MSDKILSPLLKELLSLDDEMNVEKGQIIARKVFYIFANEDEPSFIDEQKVYDKLDKLAKLAVVLENYPYHPETRNGKPVQHSF